MIAVCLFLLAAAAAPFDHPANHRGTSEITEFNTLGERCSGTSFVDALIRANFPSTKRRQRFAHKHFFPWFDLSDRNEQVMSPWRVDEERFLEGSENNLFVLVVRNCEDWIRSFFLQPFYVPKQNRSRGLLHFINSKWAIDLPVLATDYYKKVLPDGWTFSWPYALDDHYYDFNVYAGRPFANIFELRSYKARNYLQIGSKAEHFVLLRYEDVREDPEGCVNYLSEYYGMAKRIPFAPVLEYKGVKAMGPYEKKEYPPLPDYIQIFMQKYWERDLEERLGFF